MIVRERITEEVAALDPRSATLRDLETPCLILDVARI